MRATSSKFNPILNQVRERLEADGGYTIEALADEGRYGTREFLNGGYTGDQIWGFYVSSHDANQADKVFKRILRIEKAELRKL